MDTNKGGRASRRERVAPRASRASGLVLGAIAAVTAAVAVAQPDAAAEARATLSRFEHEPTVNQVQQLALDYAALHPEMYANMRSRSRYAAALPELRVRVQKDLDEESRALTRFESNVADNISGTEVNRDRAQVQGEVKWRLGEMVFNARETAVVRENRFAVRERQKLLQTVTEVYFDRRRSQLELLLSPPADLEARALMELKIAQLTSELDGMTGGGFSRLMAGQPGAR